MTNQRLGAVLFLWLGALLLPAPVLAAHTQGPNQVAVIEKTVWPVSKPLGFRTELSRAFSVMVPFTGALVFTVNQSGIISGLYESDSVRPDPLYGRQIPVTGTVSGNNIHLQIGSGARVITINGTYTDDKVSGQVLSGLSNGIWTFGATRVHLQAPPQNT
jgi:hypothetical protein